MSVRVVLVPAPSCITDKTDSTTIGRGTSLECGHHMLGMSSPTPRPPPRSDEATSTRFSRRNGTSSPQSRRVQSLRLPAPVSDPRSKRRLKRSSSSADTPSPLRTRGGSLFAAQLLKEEEKKDIYVKWERIVAKVIESSRSKHEVGDDHTRKSAPKAGLLSSILKDLQAGTQSNQFLDEETLADAEREHRAIYLQTNPYKCRSDRAHRTRTLLDFNSAPRIYSQFFSSRYGRSVSLEPTCPMLKKQVMSINDAREQEILHTTFLSEDWMSDLHHAQLKIVMNKLYWIHSGPVEVMHVSDVGKFKSYSVYVVLGYVLGIKNESGIAVLKSTIDRELFEPRKRAAYAEKLLYECSQDDYVNFFAVQEESGVGHRVLLRAAAEVYALEIIVVEGTGTGMCTIITPETKTAVQSVTVYQLDDYHFLPGIPLPREGLRKVRQEAFSPSGQSIEELLQQSNVSNMYRNLTNIQECLPENIAAVKSALRVVKGNAAAIIEASIDLDKVSFQEEVLNICERQRLRIETDLELMELIEQAVSKLPAAALSNFPDMHKLYIFGCWVTTLNRFASVMVLRGHELNVIVVNALAVCSIWNSFTALAKKLEQESDQIVARAMQLIESGQGHKPALNLMVQFMKPIDEGETVVAERKLVSKSSYRRMAGRRRGILDMEASAPREGSNDPIITACQACFECISLNKKFLFASSHHEDVMYAVQLMGHMVFMYQTLSSSESRSRISTELFGLWTSIVEVALKWTKRKETCTSRKDDLFFALERLISFCGLGLGNGYIVREQKHAEQIQNSCQRLFHAMFELEGLDVNEISSSLAPKAFDMEWLHRSHRTRALLSHVYFVMAQASSREETASSITAVRKSMLSPPVDGKSASDIKSFYSWLGLMLRRLWINSTESEGKFAARMQVIESKALLQRFAQHASSSEATDMTVKKLFMELISRVEYQLVGRVRGSDPSSGEDSSDVWSRIINYELFEKLTVAQLVDVREQLEAALLATSRLQDSSLQKEYSKGAWTLLALTTARMMETDQVRDGHHAVQVLQSTLMTMPQMEGDKQLIEAFSRLHRMCHLRMRGELVVSYALREEETHKGAEIRERGVLHLLQRLMKKGNVSKQLKMRASYIQYSRQYLATAYTISLNAEAKRQGWSVTGIRHPAGSTFSPATIRSIEDLDGDDMYMLLGGGGGSLPMLLHGAIRALRSLPEPFQLVCFAFVCNALSAFSEDRPLFIGTLPMGVYQFTPEPTQIMPRLQLTPTRSFFKLTGKNARHLPTLLDRKKSSPLLTTVSSQFSRVDRSPRKASRGSPSQLLRKRQGAGIAQGASGTAELEDGAANVGELLLLGSTSYAEATKMEPSLDGYWDAVQPFAASIRSDIITFQEKDEERVGLAIPKSAQKLLWHLLRLMVETNRLSSEGDNQDGRAPGQRIQKRTDSTITVDTHSDTIPDWIVAKLRALAQCAKDAVRTNALEANMSDATSGSPGVNDISALQVTGEQVGDAVESSPGKWKVPPVPKSAPQKTAEPMNIPSGKFGKRLRAALRNYNEGACPFGPDLSGGSGSSLSGQHSRAESERGDHTSNVVPVVRLLQRRNIDLERLDDIPRCIAVLSQDLGSADTSFFSFTIQEASSHDNQYLQMQFPFMCQHSRDLATAYESAGYTLLAARYYWDAFVQATYILGGSWEPTIAVDPEFWDVETNGESVLELLWGNVERTLSQVLHPAKYLQVLNATIKTLSDGYLVLRSVWEEKGLPKATIAKRTTLMGYVVGWVQFSRLYSLFLTLLESQSAVALDRSSPILMIDDIVQLLIETREDNVQISQFVLQLLKKKLQLLRRQGISEGPVYMDSWKDAVQRTRSYVSILLKLGVGDTIPKAIALIEELMDVELRPTRSDMSDDDLVQLWEGVVRGIVQLKDLETELDDVNIQVSLSSHSGSFSWLLDHFKIYAYQVASSATAKTSVSRSYSEEDVYLDRFVDIVPHEARNQWKAIIRSWPYIPAVCKELSRLYRFDNSLNFAMQHSALVAHMYCSYLGDKNKRVLDALAETTRIFNKKRTEETNRSYALDDGETVTEYEKYLLSHMKNMKPSLFYAEVEKKRLRQPGLDRSSISNRASSQGRAAASGFWWPFAFLWMIVQFFQITFVNTVVGALSRGWNLVRPLEFVFWPYRLRYSTETVGIYLKYQLRVSGSLKQATDTLRGLIYGIPFMGWACLVYFICVAGISYDPFEATYGSVSAWVRGYSHTHWVLFLPAFVDCSLLLIAMMAVSWAKAPNTMLKGNLVVLREKLLKRMCVIVSPDQSPAALKRTLEAALGLHTGTPVFSATHIYVADYGRTEAERLPWKRAVDEVCTMLHQLTGAKASIGYCFVPTTKALYAMYKVARTVIPEHGSYVMLLNSSHRLPPELYVPIQEFSDSNIDCIAIPTVSMKTRRISGLPYITASFWDLNMKLQSFHGLFQSSWGTLLSFENFVQIWRTDVFVATAWEHSTSAVGYDFELSHRHRQQTSNRVVVSSHTPIPSEQPRDLVSWDMFTRGSSSHNVLVRSILDTSASVHRSLLLSLHQLVFFWRRDTLVLKPYLVLRIMQTLVDMILVPCMVFGVLYSWRDLATFAVIVSAARLLLYSGFIEWTLRDRYDMKLSVFILPFYLLWEGLMRVCSIIGLVYLLGKHLPFSQSSPPIREWELYSTPPSRDHRDYVEVQAINTATNEVANVHVRCGQAGQKLYDLVAMEMDMLSEEMILLSAGKDVEIDREMTIGVQISSGDTILVRKGTRRTATGRLRPSAPSQRMMSGSENIIVDVRNLISDSLVVQSKRMMELKSDQRDLHSKVLRVEDGLVDISHILDEQRKAIDRIVDKEIREGRLGSHSHGWQSNSAGSSTSARSRRNSVTRRTIMPATPLSDATTEPYSDIHSTTGSLMGMDEPHGRGLEERFSPFVTPSHGSSAKPGATPRSMSSTQSGTSSQQLKLHSNFRSMFRQLQSKINTISETRSEIPSPGSPMPFVEKGKRPAATAKVGIWAPPQPPQTVDAPLTAQGVARRLTVATMHLSPDSSDYSEPSSPAASSSIQSPKDLFVTAAAIERDRRFPSAGSSSVGTSRRRQGSVSSSQRTDSNTDSSISKRKLKLLQNPNQCNQQ